MGRVRFNYWSVYCYRESWYKFSEESICSEMSSIWYWILHRANFQRNLFPIGLFHYYHYQQYLHWYYWVTEFEFWWSIHLESNYILINSPVTMFPLEIVQQRPNCVSYDIAVIFCHCFVHFFYIFLHKNIVTWRLWFD